MNDSAKLLAEFRQTGSEEVFQRLVEEHIDHVYSTARRLLAGDVHTAQDVTQIAFSDLARRPEAVPARMPVAAWLHRHTCFVAMKWLRTEQRRRAREERATSDIPISSPHDFDPLTIALDRAIDTLREKDRIAILLRYAEDYDFEHIGQVLQIKPAAAQRRVSRALEKLRRSLKGQSLSVSAAALGAISKATFAVEAPRALAAQVTAVALKNGISHGLPLLPFSKLATMKTVKTTAAALIVALGTVVGVSEHHAASRARAESAHLASQLALEQNETGRLSNQLARLSPAPTRNTPDQNLEIVRLRRQVTEMRERATSAESALALHRNGGDSIADPDLRRKEDWRWTGFSSADDTLETVLYAMRVGSYGTLLASSTSDARKALEKQFAERSNEEIEEILKANVAAISAIRLSLKHQISANEVEFALQDAQANPSGTAAEPVLRFVFTGQAWLLKAATLN